MKQAENYTDGSSENLTTHKDWTVLLGYALIVVSGACIIITLYLIVCVAIFIKSKSYEKCTKARGTARQNNSASGGATNNGINESDQAAYRRQRAYSMPGQKKSFQAVQFMHLVLLLTLIVNLLRGVVEQLIYFYGGASDSVCDILTKVMIGITAFGIHGCLVFLWLRQYVFYINPLLRKIRPKSLRLISYSTYVAMVVTVLTCLVLHLWWRGYESVDGICRPALGSRKVSVYVPFLILVGSTVTIQISLTFLFVYPIVCHNQQMKMHKRRSKDQPEDLGSSCVSRSTIRLLKCVKRALIGATVGISTDIAGALVAIWLPEDMPVFVLSILYEFDIMLNVFCLLYTYVDWREIFSPWKGLQKLKLEDFAKDTVPFRC